MIRTFLRTAAALLAAAAIATMPAAATAAAPNDAPLPVPALELRAPVSRTLPNGLRVVVMPVHRQHLVQVQLMVPAGSAQEPDSLPGLAAMTADLLRQGTTSRTAAQFDDELAASGGILSTWAGRDYALVQCAARPNALEKVCELLSDMAINPLFGGDDFATSLKAYGRKLELARQTLADLADQRVGDAAFAPHPYAHSAGSDLPAILAASAGEVTRFHRDRWRPDRAVLAIAGDVDPERAFALASDWFGGWSGHAAPERARPAPRPHAGVRIVDVPLAGPRAEVRVALVGPGLASRDYASWALAEAALESGGLPPGVRATLAPASDASLLVLASTTLPSQSAAQARRMADALHALAASPPSGGALDALRRRAAQRYPLGLETLGERLGQWQADDAAGLPGDALERGGEQLGAADLAAVLPRLSAPPVILVVGAADSLREPLAALGEVEVVGVDPVHAPPPDSLPEPTAEELRRGRLAVAAAVTAHGGAAALKNLKTLVLEGDEFVYRDDKEIPSQFSHVWVGSDHFSSSNKVFQLEARQLIVGNRGWSVLLSDSIVSARLDSASFQALRQIAHDDLVHELLTAAAPGARPALRGTEMLDGRTCDRVDFTGPFGRERMLLDATTHRVAAIDALPAPGPVWLERRTLSDYRPVNGLQLPFAEDRTLSGARNSHVITRLALVNSDVDMHLLNPPADLAR